MGQESLEKLSIEKYLSEWRKGFREEMHKQYLFDHFMIGEGANKDKLDFYRLYLDSFCTDNCELSNWIWKKINGYFEDVHISGDGKVIPLKYQPVENIMKVYNNCSWKSRSW